MSIGSRIREARKSANMTQQQLADKSGLKQAALSELETGESAGSKYLASIAAALGVSALWLETGRGLRSPFEEADRKKEAHMILAYDDEARLLDLYRRTDDRGRFDIIKLAISEFGRVNKPDGPM
jgi:transcriptional regulator with XRE-family HTH domain